MFGWIEKVLKLPAALKLARMEKQDWESMKPVRRFVELFESHGVARTQIPGFLKDFNSTLSLADVRNDETLLHKLDESLLDKVCEMFGVRREWLDGVDEEVYHLHNFYKHPEQFSEFIKGLKCRN